MTERREAVLIDQDERALLCQQAFQVRDDNSSCERIAGVGAVRWDSIGSRPQSPRLVQWREEDNRLDRGVDTLRHMKARAGREDRKGQVSER